MGTINQMNYKALHQLEKLQQQNTLYIWSSLIVSMSYVSDRVDIREGALFQQHFNFHMPLDSGQSQNSKKKQAVWQEGATACACGNVNILVLIRHIWLIPS